MMKGEKILTRKKHALVLIISQIKVDEIVVPFFIIGLIYTAKINCMSRFAT